MALQKYNARDIVFQIEDFASPGTWVPIAPGGIETFSRGFEEETTPTTTFGSNGNAESQKMEVGKTLGIEGKRLRDNVTGALDPGQSIVEAMNDRLGEQSLTGFRFAHKDDTVWQVWPQARISLGEQGGGNNDKVGWSATFTRSGANTTAVKS
jgi:hypothetical protein